MSAKAQDAIVAAAIDPAMRMPIDWIGIPVRVGDQEGTFFAMCDALKVGEPGDCVRINVSCDSQQKICDKLGLQMLTPIMLDLMYEYAEIEVAPCTFTPDSNGLITVTHPITNMPTVVSMSSVTAMFAHDARVSRALGAHDGHSALVCNAGKIWCLSSKLGPASAQGGWICANYGWYNEHAPYLNVTQKTHVWQPLSTAHNQAHVDYSQVFVAAHPVMIVGGKQVPTADVLTDPAMAHLISHEGALKWSRHPRLPVYAANGSVTPVAPAVGDMRMVAKEADTQPEVPVPFVQAKYFKNTTVRQIDLVVLHTMENSEKPGTAMAVAKWFAGPNSPVASAHYCVDNRDIVQCVKEGDVSYGAPGANHNGIQIEHAGYASQTDDQWNDPYSRAMIDKSVELTAGICKRYSLPVEFVDADGLLDGDRGITTHAQVTLACQKAQSQGMTGSPFFNTLSNRPLTDHTDPGGHFPMDEYISAVAATLPKALSLPVQQ